MNAVIKQFQKWLMLPDPGALLIALGAVAANRMPGIPVWPLLVGSPGSGKTELVQSLFSLPDVHRAGTLTEAGLLSGSMGSNSVQAGGGLLRTVGESGIIAMKDFTSTLQMRPQGRGPLLAALREIYDGNWTRHVGSGGGQTLHWKGKCGFIAGCTPVIDRHHGVMASMGERFLLYRLAEVDPEELASRALDHSGRDTEMQKELQAAVEVLFRNLTIPDVPLQLQQQDGNRIINVSTLITRCRSAVERSGSSRVIEYIPEPEAPSRLTLTLAQLSAGLAALGVPQEECWRLICKIGFDSMPAMRLKVLRAVVHAGKSTTTTNIAAALAHPDQTIRRALEDLAAHHVLIRQAGGDGNPDFWDVSDSTRLLLAAVGPVPGD